MRCAWHSSTRVATTQPTQASECMTLDGQASAPRRRGHGWGRHIRWEIGSWMGTLVSASSLASGPGGPDVEV